MSKEFKISVAYRNYMLNVFCTSESTLAEVSLVGMLVGNDYEILDSVGDVLHIVDFEKVMDVPREAQIAFSHFLADGGSAILDAKIAGEPEEEVVAVPVTAKPKPAPKKRAPRKKA